MLFVLHGFLTLSYGTCIWIGYSSGSISMHGALAGVRGPFTPSQWMELEHFVNLVVEQLFSY